MNHHNSSSQNQKIPVMRNVAPTIDQSVYFRSHLLRVKALTNSLARKREELKTMRLVAMAKVEKAIEAIYSLDRSSKPPMAAQLLSELEGALDELNALETEELPRPGHLFAIAERLKQLNEKLPDQCAFL